MWYFTSIFVLVQYASIIHEDEPPSLKYSGVYWTYAVRKGSLRTRENPIFWYADNKFNNTNVQILS